MQRKKRLLLLVILSVFVTFILLVFNTPWFSSSAMRESFVYHPQADERLLFSEAETKLYISDVKDENEYSLEMEYSAKLNIPAYSIHSIALLFENGILVDYKADKEVKTDSIEGKLNFHGKDSGRHEAVTYYYAESKYGENSIKSKQTMSSDIIYISDSPLAPLTSFELPGDEEERKTKQLLDSVIEQQLNFVWEGLTEEFGLNEEEYFKIPLNEFPEFLSRLPESIQPSEAAEITGRLWEGIYRYYILGADTFTDSPYNPAGNIMPLVLLHRNGGHLITVYETSENHKQQILQLIPYVR
ncbi:hypothetical protein MM300_16140 [Evansella sp. LMS18]|uniref:hypothetical protein n=1 Tax=Evansella sp. LMS18 TaxID=2924033 RepID=UPI0020CFEF7A|nr:hypothetical protein [Evansella sp. LMS18]UTR09414.1 hypothetical protein MM300_16140 [Evansella sp. LMS18]